MFNARLPQDVRILLAEDNDINSALATRMLSRLGYSVDTVLNGREAIHALQNKTYDIVLMDVHMPEMDGLAATRWILANPTRIQSMPLIIALTANTLPEDRQRCSESGMVDFISKPIGFDALSRILQKWTQQAA